MDNNRLCNLLETAAATIEQQRAQIERLKPKADAYDRLGQVLDLAVGAGNAGTYGVDALWEIRSALEEIHADQQRAKENQHAHKPAPGREDTFQDIVEREREAKAQRMSVGEIHGEPVTAAQAQRYFDRQTEPNTTYKADDRYTDQGSGTLRT